MRITLLCLLALIVCGCADPGPQVRAYTAATDAPINEYVRLMGEYAHLSSQVDKRLQSTSYTPELAQRMGTDLMEAIKPLRMQFEAARIELGKAPPAPKEAEKYARAVNDMFDMMDKLLTAYADLADEMQKGAGGSRDRVEKLSRDMATFSAAAAVSIEDATKLRKELDAKYPEKK